MLDHATPASSAAVSVIEGSAAEVLSDIYDPGCAAAIWRRGLDASFTAWLAELPAAQLPALRVELTPAEAAGAVDRACAEAGLPKSEGRAFLAEDAGRLATRFAKVMRVKALHLRFDVVNTNACKKFHLDHVPARLLCTYRGAGTEYGAACADGVPADIRRMEAGWVGLFRGRRWPGPESCGLVHRSPPIEGSGETRLLLVIDAAGPR